MKNSFRCDNILRCLVLGGAFVMMVLMLSGCAAQRGVGKPSVTEKDSTDVKVVYKIVYLPDTAHFDIPNQTAERTTADSTSFLENDYSTSEARINPDGSLFHNLNTKPQKKPVPIIKPVIQKDSVRVEYRDKKVEVPIEVVVEKPLTWWQHTSVTFFPYCLATLIVALGWIFRKPIGKLLSIVKQLI